MTYVYVNYVKFNYLNDKGEELNSNDRYNYALEILVDDKVEYVGGLNFEELLEFNEENMLEKLKEEKLEWVVNKINEEGMYEFNGREIYVKSEDELFPLEDEEKEIEQKDEVWVVVVQNGEICGTEKINVVETLRNPMTSTYRLVKEYGRNLTLYMNEGNFKKETKGKFKNYVVKGVYDEVKEDVVFVDVEDEDIRMLKDLYSKEGMLGHFAEMDYIYDKYDTELDEEDLKELTGIEYFNR